MNLRWNFLLMAVSGTLAGFLIFFFGGPKPKPIVLNFSHMKHLAIACEVCHQGVRSQSNAVIPSTTLCAKCHNTSPDNTRAGLAIWQATQKNAPWVWPVSYRLPHHVYFSHRRHVVLAKLECAACHGNMKAQKVPVFRSLKTLNMDRCMDCHRQKQVVDDCAQCHR